MALEVKTREQLVAEARRIHGEVVQLLVDAAWEGVDIDWDGKLSAMRDGFAELLRSEGVNV